MEENRLVPFGVETELTNYMPLPRSVLLMDLPMSAMLQYAALLDRGTLSRKNHFADAEGWIYVFFPLEEMARMLRLSRKAIQNNQRLLEDAGLIRRVHTSRDRGVRIHLRIPQESDKFPEEGNGWAGDREKEFPPMAQKVPPNNISKQHKLNNNYYQHNEEESL